MTDDQREPQFDDPSAVGDAFDRLREDVKAASADQALHRLQQRRAGFGWRPLLVGAAAIILVIVGFVAMRDDGDDVIASDLAAGESDSDLGEDEPIPATAERLEGTAWTLIEGRGQGGEIPLVDGWPITISFDAEVFAGTAACNGYGGRLALDENGPIGQEIAQTTAACGTDIEASEAAYLRVLIVVDTAEFRGASLVLTGPDGNELVFARAATVAIDELVDRTWRLVGLIRDGETTEPAGAPATLRLHGNGVVTGGTGCRLLSGEWVSGGAEVQFPSFGAEGECPSELADQDGLVVNVLGDGFVPRLDGDRLELTSVGGEGLVYRLDDPEATSSTVPPTDISSRLTDTRWVLVEGTVPEGSFPTPAASFTIDFGSDGRVGTGQAHCDRYGVHFGELLGGVGPAAEIEADGIAAPCRLFSPVVGAAEFVAALLAIDEVNLVDDELILIGPDIELRFLTPALLGVFDFVFADRDNRWVDVHGYVGDRGGGMFLCGIPPNEEGGCDDFWVAMVGDTPDPALVGDSTVVRGALDDWGRLVVDPDAELRERATDAADAFQPLPSDEDIALALLTGALSDPALIWHPDGVRLTLGGDQHELLRSPAELADSANWIFDVESFRGGNGPVSALEALASGLPLRVYTGAHPHCADVPMPLPAVDFDRHLVIETDPTEDAFSTCAQWFAVDVLIDDGVIVAVNFDRWGGP